MKQFLALLSAIAICALFCVGAFALPKMTARADDSAVADLAQTVFSTTVALANTIQNPTSEGVAILASQAALAYMYYSNNGSPPSAGANGDGAKYYAGYTTFTDDHLYFGAGSINANSTLTSVSISSSTANNSISAYRYLADSGYIGNCRTVGAGAQGIGAPAGHGEAFIIATSGSGSQSHLAGMFNGDPMTGALSIGVVDALSRATTSYNTETSKARFLFWSGSADVTSIVPPSGGSFVEQYEALQEELQEEYPDESEDYYVVLDPVQDPTETPSGCHCTVNVEVNVEPTINVEVNVEPTIIVEMPSDWLEDYTAPSGAEETIAFPEEPSTMPEIEFDEDLVDGLHFWRDLWEAVVTYSDLTTTITIILVLSIVEFLLWNVGR